MVVIVLLLSYLINQQALAQLDSENPARIGYPDGTWWVLTSG